MFANLEAAMHHCDLPFNEARASAWEDCFDPEIVLSTPAGEYRGRKQVMPSLNEAYFKGAPGVHFEMTPHNFRSFGEAFCYSYDYRIDEAGPHRAGHGVALCHRVNAKGRIRNLYNALLEPTRGTKPEASRRQAH
jgi:hypothetical protein